MTAYYLTDPLFHHRDAEAQRGLQPQRKMVETTKTQRHEEPQRGAAAAPLGSLKKFRKNKATHYLAMIACFVFTKFFQTARASGAAAAAQTVLRVCLGVFVTLWFSNCLRALAVDYEGPTFLSVAHLRKG